MAERLLRLHEVYPETQPTKPNLRSMLSLVPPIALAPSKRIYLAHEKEIVNEKRRVTLNSLRKLFESTGHYLEIFHNPKELEEAILGNVQPIHIVTALILGKKEAKQGLDHLADTTFDHRRLNNMRLIALTNNSKQTTVSTTLFEERLVDAHFPLSTETATIVRKVLSL